MSATTVGSYLVIARYGAENWAKWKATASDQKELARQHAMELFPMTADPLPPNHTIVAHAFHTGIFAEIPDNQEWSEENKVEKLNDIFTTLRGNAPGTDEKDPGVG